MPASIRTTVYKTPGGQPGGSPAGSVVTDKSRDDLRLGNEVVALSVDAAQTYAWSLSFVPESSGPSGNVNDGIITSFQGTPSNAALTIAPGTPETCKFTVDYEGAYLLRLVVDAGLPTESTQYVRLRYLTKFADLKLLAAGERRDENGVVPVDATAEGWSNDQNQNFQRLAALIRRTATSGRVLYVDANRGRDNSNDQNDPDTIIRMPGPDNSAPDETGIRVQAEGFADFDSIMGAVTYANNAVARGEAAPGYNDPYWIVIQPGYYEEDLILGSHIHLINGQSLSALFTVGTSTPLTVQTKGVVVRTTSGQDTFHRFSPTGGPAADHCILFGLTLENTGVTTEPVLKHEGGALSLTRCVVDQRANGANQGPCIYTVTADAAKAPALALGGTTVRSLADADDQRYAIVVDAASGSLALTAGSEVSSAGAGVQVNKSLYGGAPGNADVLVSIQDAVISTMKGICLEAYCLRVQVQKSHLTAENTPTAISFTPFGQGNGALGSGWSFDLAYTDVSGDILVDDGGATGQTEFVFDAVGLEGNLVFPNGTPDNLTTTVTGKSLKYDSNYSKPEKGAGAPAEVPANAQLGVNNVQDALDLLVQFALPLGNVPFWSLGSAYNGLSSVNPVVYGGGLGRTVLADDGAVQITGANAPFDLDTGVLNGGLQVEGVADIGPLVNDGKGSEININPNPFGAGPVITLGRAVWPDDMGAQHRSIPAGFIIAGADSDQPTGTIYNLHLRTKHETQSASGELGRVIVQAGSASAGQAAAPQPGSIFLQAGSNHDNASAKGPGEIWIAPGFKVGGAEGKVWFVGASGTACTLTARNVFAGGQAAGNFYVATPNGTEVFLVAANDTLNDVISTINTASSFLKATDAGGKLKLEGVGAGDGPNTDIFYVGDDQAGAINTKLGELRVNSGAVFVPGAYGDKIGVSVPQDQWLKVYGTLEADQFVGGGIGGLGSYVRIDENDGTPGAPYQVQVGEGFIGCDVSNANVGVELPSGRPAGTVVVVSIEVPSAIFGTHVAVTAPAGEVLLHLSNPGIIQGSGTEIYYRTDQVDQGGDVIWVPWGKHGDPLYRNEDDIRWADPDVQGFSNPYAVLPTTTFLRARTKNNPITIELPENGYGQVDEAGAPERGRRIGLKDYSYNASGNNITVTVEGRSGNASGGTPTTLILDALHQVNAPNTYLDWYVDIGADTALLITGYDEGTNTITTAGFLAAPLVGDPYKLYKGINGLPSLVLDWDGVYLDFLWVEDEWITLDAQKATGSYRGVSADTTIDGRSQTELLGVNTSGAGGNITITLNAWFKPGRKITIKDEGLNAAARNIIIKASGTAIEGVFNGPDGELILTQDKAAAVLYRGASGFFLR